MAKTCNSSFSTGGGVKVFIFVFPKVPQSRLKCPQIPVCEGKKRLFPTGDIIPVYMINHQKSHMALPPLSMSGHSEKV